MPQNQTAMDLVSLESRIQQATELIVKLKAERDELRKAQRELETRTRRAESAAQSALEFRRRAQEAEAHLAQFKHERTTLARRVEQMLEKLRAVEEDRLGVP